jgi:Kelch motif
MNIANVSAYTETDHDLIQNTIKPQVWVVTYDDGDSVRTKLGKYTLDIKKDFSSISFSWKTIEILDNNWAQIHGISYVAYTGTGISSEVLFAWADKREVRFIYYDDKVIIRAVWVDISSIILSDLFYDVESSRFSVGSVESIYNSSWEIMEKKEYIPTLELEDFLVDHSPARISTDRDTDIQKYYKNTNSTTLIDKKLPLWKTKILLPPWKVQEFTLVYDFHRSIWTDSYVSLDTFQWDPYAIDEIYKMGGLSSVKKNSFFYANTPQIWYLDTELGKYIEIRLTSELDATYIARRDNTVYYQWREDIYAYTLGTGKNREKIKDSVIIQSPREKNQYTYEVRGNYHLNPNDDGSVGVFTQNLNKAWLTETCSDEYYTRVKKDRLNDLQKLSSWALIQKYGKSDIDTESFCVSPSIIKEKKKEIAYDVDVFRIERPIILDRDDQLIDIPISVIAGSGNTLSYSFDASMIDEHRFPIRFDPTLTTDVGLKEADIDNITIPWGAGLGTPDVGDGSLGTWNGTTSMITGRHGINSSIYNWYIYVVWWANWSIYSSALSSVEYAPINANWSIWSWISTSSVITGRNSYGMITYNGYIYVAWWINGSALSSVEYARINANGSLGNWTSTTNMSLARSYMSMAVYNWYVYAVGWWEITGISSVEYTQINANGSLGNWTSTTNMIVWRWWSPWVGIYNGYIYAIWWVNWSLLSSVEYAPINANGSLGNWTSTTSISSARSMVWIGLYAWYIYVVWWWNWGNSISLVQYAPINANGSLGNWTSTTSLWTQRKWHGSLVYNGYLYAVWWLNWSALNATEYARIKPPSWWIGTWTSTTDMRIGRFLHGTCSYNWYLYVAGWHNTDAWNAMNSVDYVSINLNWSIGAWNITQSMNNIRWAFALYAYNWYIYAIWWMNWGPAFSSTEYAPINPDGSLGTWTVSQSMLTPRTKFGLVAYNWYMYAIGWDWLSTTEYAPINANGSLWSWQSGSNLLTPRYAHWVTTYNGYIYVVWWSNWWLSANNTTEYAPINANGSLWSWQSGSSMSMNRKEHGVLAFKGYIYAIGWWEMLTATTSTEYAPINANGSLWSWQSGSNLLTPRYAHWVTTYNGYIYAVGGFRPDFTGTPNVEYTPILGNTSNAGLWSWLAWTSMNSPRDNHAWAWQNWFIYAIGGSNGGSTVLSSTEYASINQDWSIWTWTGTTPMTSPRRQHFSVIYNNYIYAIGGSNGGTPRSSTEYASINQDWSIWTWTGTTPMTSPRFNHVSVIYNNYIYTLWWYSSWTVITASTEYASINQDWSIWTWTGTTPMSISRASLWAVAYNWYIYAVSWQSSWFIDISYTEYAKVALNGEIWPWIIWSSLLIPRGSRWTAVYNWYIYLIWWWNSSWLLSSVEYAKINLDWTLTDWNSTTPLLTSRSNRGVVSYNGYIYIFWWFNTSTLVTTEYAKIGTPVIQSWHKLYDRGSASMSPVYVSLGYANRLDPDTQIRYTLWDSIGTTRLYKGSWVPLSSYVVPSIENKITLNTYGQNFRYLEFEIMRPTGRDKMDNNIVSIGYGELSCLVCGGWVATINWLCIIDTSMSCSNTDIDVQNGWTLDVRSPAAIDFDFNGRKLWIRNGWKVIVRNGAKMN